MMHVIAIGRPIAPIYYMGGTAHGQDLWTTALPEAAHYCTEGQALTVAGTLKRWLEYPIAGRRIEAVTPRLPLADPVVPIT